MLFLPTKSTLFYYKTTNTQTHSCIMTSNIFQLDFFWNILHALHTNIKAFSVKLTNTMHPLQIRNTPVAANSTFCCKATSHADGKEAPGYRLNCSRTANNIAGRPGNVADITRFEE